MEGALAAVDVFCLEESLSATSAVSTSKTTPFPKRCRPDFLVVRRWLICRFTAAITAAVFVAIALMSITSEALATACSGRSGRSAATSAPASARGGAGGCASGVASPILLEDAKFHLVGDAHVQRSGGQMDGVLPQLLIHHLDAPSSLSALSATQVVESPPSTRAVGKRWRTDAV